MKVEVVFALPGRQWVVPLDVPEGTSVQAAVEASALLDEARAQGQEPVAFGVWGRIADPAMLLREGDRVELYRPLQVDPKEARRRRAGRD